MPAVKTPVPTLVRLEYLSPTGWVRMGDQNLLHPEAVVPRYRAKGKFARVTVLDDTLQPKGKVWVADDVPADPSILVKANDGSCPWKLPDPTKTCSLCSEEHPPPYDGRCLL